MRLYVEGQWTPTETGDVSRLPCPALGFTHGLGAFETLRVHRGRPLFWNAHWRRLSRGASAQGILLPIASEVLLNVVAGWLGEDGLEEARLKITLWAGPVAEGEPYWSPSPSAILGVELTPLASDKPLFSTDALRLTLPVERWKYRAPAYKPLAYQPYLLARREATRFGYDDALLVDETEKVLETSSANLIWERNGELETTPAVDGSIIPGTVRELLLTRGVPPIRERFLHTDELKHVRALWVLNAFIGIAPVASIQGYWDRGEPTAPATGMLTSLYAGFVEAEMGSEPSVG